MDPTCIFCKIINKDIPAHRVYEDSDTISFLSIRPIREGHVLTVPKKHEPYFYKLDDESFEKAMRVAKHIAEISEKIFNPKRVGVIIAGFDIPHTHIHTIPMHDYHDITSKPILDNTAPEPTQIKLAETAEKIKAVL
jgi:histidine triad (HIT) family protein